MDWTELRELARKSLESQARSLGLRAERFVLIMGAYQPETSKSLLFELREELRNRFHDSAFLMEDFNLPVDLDAVSRVLFELSAITVFVVTNEGIQRGWQYELGDLKNVGSAPEGKIAVYYEDFDKLPAPVQDFLLGHAVRHGHLVDNSNHKETVEGIVIKVNTFFLGLDSTPGA